MASACLAHSQELTLSRSTDALFGGGDEGVIVSTTSLAGAEQALLSCSQEQVSEMITFAQLAPVTTEADPIAPSSPADLIALEMSADDDKQSPLAGDEQDEEASDDDTEEPSLAPPPPPAPPVATAAFYSCSLTIECPICEEETPTWERLSCSHRFCHTCIRGMLEQVVASGSNMYHLECPSCNQINNSQHFYRQIDTDLAGRLTSLQELATRDKTVVRAWCPRKNCGAELLIDDTASRARCAHCNRSFCCTCLEAHSRFVGCSTAEMGKCVASPTRAASQLRKAWSTKPCPSCGWRIEKNGGCSHMSCSNCHYYFCWRCGHNLNKGGMHCWGLAIGLGTAAVVFGVPAAVITAPVWVPVGAIVVGGIMLHDRRQKQRRRRLRGY